MTSIKKPFARNAKTFICAGLVCLILSGCVLAPSGTAQEQRRLDQHSQFQRPLEKRELPPLPSQASWQDVLRHAFLANGELESAWFEWKAAMARIDQAASWPNSSLMVGYSYMFSGGNMKAWDRSTFAFQPDPSMNLQLPIKPAQAGKVALQDARAAGDRFAAMKFYLQRRVLDAYYDLALVEEGIRIQQRNVQLLESLSQSARARVQSGAPQQDLFKAQIEYRLARTNWPICRSKLSPRGQCSTGCCPDPRRRHLSCCRRCRLPDPFPSTTRGCLLWECPRIQNWRPGRTSSRQAGRP